MNRRLTLALRANVAMFMGAPGVAMVLMAARTRAALVVESRRRDAGRASWLSAIGAASASVGFDGGEQVGCGLADQASQLDGEGSGSISFGGVESG